MPHKTVVRSCDGNCGDYCCRELKRTVTVEEKVILESLAVERGIVLNFDDDEWSSLRTWEDLPCPFYEKGRCGIYEHRPLLCQMWSCEACGTVEQRRRSSREQFKRGRSRENGWIRFQPPPDDGDDLDAQGREANDGADSR